MKIDSPNTQDLFFSWLRTPRGCSKRTVEAYREDLTLFTRWFKESNGRGPDPGDITSIDLREYQSYLQNVRGLKPATVNRRLSGVKAFVQWAVQEGHIIRSPTFPKLVRRQPLPPRSLARKEQNGLLRELERRGKARDIALVRLLMSCGLRVGEAVTLQVSDLELSDRRGKVTVRNGKGVKWRDVPVPPETRKAIHIWLQEKNLLYPGSPWVFPNRNGGHITVRNAEGVVSNVARFAGLRIYPHVLRHTAATNMLRSGTDLVTVAQILGHESLNTTAIYTKPRLSDMSRALENAEL